MGGKYFRTINSETTTTNGINHGKLVNKIVTKESVAFFVRVFVFLATISATLVMALSKEEKSIVVGTIGTTPIRANVTAKFQHTPAFVFFVIVNAMINVALISGGATAAAYMGQLGREGNSHANWNRICDKVGTFCDHSGAAILASLIGLALMIILTATSISDVRKDKPLLDDVVVP